MLEFFRRNINGLLGVVVILTLVVAFALSFGAQSKGWGEGQTERYAASVDGNKIPAQTLNYALRLLTGGIVDPNDPKSAEIHRVALGGLIEREILLALADSMHITATADEAEQAIVENKLYLTLPVAEIFKRIEQSPFSPVDSAAEMVVREGHRVRSSFNDQNGKFDLNTYQKFVRNHLQLSEEGFVDEQRKELVAMRVRELIASAVRIAPEEVREAYDRESDTATLDYIRLMPSYFEEKMTPVAAEFSAWTAANTDAIKKYYETNQGKYKGLEKSVRARHILIKVEEGATAEQKTEARAKIDGLLAKVKAGEDFATLARQNSEDPGSKSKGGDLGFNAKGKMVPAFDDVMFKLGKGEISDVVETPFGFHVIKVEDIREGDISLPQATPEIADQLYRKEMGAKQAENTANEFIAKLKAGASFESLIPANDDNEQSYMSLKVRTTPPIKRTDKSISGIGESKELIVAAFGMTKESPLAEQPFKVRDDFFVVKLNDRKQPTDEDFEKNKDQISSRLLAMKQASWIQARVTELVEKARKDGRIEEFTPPIAPAAEPEPEAPGTTPEDAKDKQADKNATPQRPAPVKFAPKTGAHATKPAKHAPKAD